MACQTKLGGREFRLHCVFKFKNPVSKGKIGQISWLIELHFSSQSWSKKI
jgi:hypothetical protein